MFLCRVLLISLLPWRKVCKLLKSDLLFSNNFVLFIFILLFLVFFCFLHTVLSGVVEPLYLVLILFVLSFSFIFLLYHVSDQLSLTHYYHTISVDFHHNFLLLLSIYLPLKHSHCENYV